MAALLPSSSTLRPWFAAVWLMITVIAIFALDLRPAAAGSNHESGPFVPIARIEAAANCVFTEHTVQAPGGLASYCQAGGHVIYRFSTQGMPSDATNIRWRIDFSGYSGAGAGVIRVGASPSTSFEVMQEFTLNASSSPKATTQSTWNHTFTPNGSVYVRVQQVSGTVYWDGLRISGLYDTPLKANLSIDANGLQSVLAGSTIKMDVTVTNAGPDAAQNVVITTSLPAGIGVGSMSGCTNQGGVPGCSLGSIAAGASKTVTLSALGTTGTTGFKTVNFTASASTMDPVSANNSTNRTVNILASRSLTVCTEWEDNNDGIFEGSRTFAYVIHHQGNRPSLDVTRTVSEGNSVCGTISTTSELLNVVPANHDGLVLANGYPKWSLLPSGNTGTSAAVLPVGEHKVTFKVKGVSVAAPTATPTNPPLPTNTPAPTNTPTPTNTPSPTNTPAATNTPVPTSTAVPATPTQPSQGGGQGTPTTPTNPPAPTGTPVGGQPDNPGSPPATSPAGDGSNPSDGRNDPEQDSGIPPAESPSDSPADDDGAADPGTGGAVSSQPVVTDPTQPADSVTEAAAPGKNNSLFLLLAGGVASAFAGLGLVAFARRKRAV